MGGLTASQRRRLQGKLIVASVSGGKDSAAMSLFLTEQGIEHRRVFLDTGWEHPATYDYLRGDLTRVLGPIEWVTPPKQMEELVRHKGMFPSRLRRFCTQELKARPMARWLRARMAEGEDPVNVVGIRAAESKARSHLTEWEFSDSYDCEIWRPLIAWSEVEVVTIHQRHSLAPNPLYLHGASRVGCWPCIYSRKGEIRLLAESDPARVVKLRILEQEVGQAAKERAESRGEAYRHAPPTFFQNPTHQPKEGKSRDGSCWPIDRVVEWSRKSKESRDEFLLAREHDGCMRWGLCEASGPD